MLPEEAKNYIGKVATPMILEVEKGAIKKYAEAIGDENLLFWDEEYAGNSRYGSIVAPPGYFGWPLRWKGTFVLMTKLRDEFMQKMAEIGFPSLLDAGIEYEFFSPIRPGDTLTASLEIESITAKEGKRGTMLTCINKTSYYNQFGVLVAIARQTSFLS
ncbi:MAG TPA: MaoC family dehydratase N-terminal domain-containing protein [Syntrophomonas sp.]|nr:MaoC family dehydratase N-terminal domain-containing protein [Syntrophomonas sp.]